MSIPRCTICGSRFHHTTLYPNWTRELLLMNLAICAPLVLGIVLLALVL
jgi:hypothetical protein